MVGHAVVWALVICVTAWSFSGKKAKAPSDSQQTRLCAKGTELEAKQTVVGYIRERHFFPLVVLEKRSMEPFNAQDLKSVTSIWTLAHGRQIPTEFAQPKRDAHSGKCIHHLSISITHSPFLEIALATSKELRNKFRPPSSKESTQFYGLNKKCIVQGDSPPGRQSPCVRPKILAVSDLNANDQLEYWHTDPYLWDTAAAVSELQEGKLKPLVVDCAFCAD